jgi:cyclic-di-AMP phosphodiesterase PgpH
MLRVNSKKRSRGFGGARPGPSESPSLAHRKQRVQRLVVLLGMVVLVGAVTEFPTAPDSSGQYDVFGESVASQTIRAAFAFESEDLEASREAREKAAAAVPNTFQIDTDRVDNQLLNLQQRITSLRDRGKEVDAALREALLASDSTESEGEVVARVLAELGAKWKEDPLSRGLPDAESLAVWLTPAPESIPKRYLEDVPADAVADTQRAVSGLSETGEEGITFPHIEPLSKLALGGLEYVLLYGVKQQGSVLGGESAESPDYIVVHRQRFVDDIKKSEEMPLLQVPDPLMARELLRTRIIDSSKNIQSEDFTILADWNLLQEAAFAMAKNSITDTLLYNQVITEGNREIARANVTPIMREFDANQIVQAEGYKWTKQSRHDVETYWRLMSTGTQRTRNIFGPLLANVIIVGLLLLALTRAIPVLVPKKANAYKTINVLLLIICITLLLGRMLRYMEPNGLLVPVVASAVLLTILTNARATSVACVIISVLLSVQYGQDWRLLIVSGAMAFTGIVSIYTVRKRGDINRAAIRATAIGWLALMAATLSSETLMNSNMVQNLFQDLLLVTLNGLMCMLLIPGLLSPLERLFGITTDIQLLEYSDLNNELLSRLAIEVPATYAHSLMMGQMAEAACDAVGANGLMARVCAYYHDIGKLRRPEYFSENQTGYNIHDDLSPRLSARAIASHVMEGAEMARDFHLPQPIIRGILEHHGTLLISFFYQQALDQQKHGDVREEDFRYPGPKPQSRETAILMICDAVESGVRSIKNPNEERIREFIDKMIQIRSEDRQFDDCELTLKQLDTIGEVLTRIIMTTHHSRISYPERPAREEADNVIRMNRGGRE